MTARLPLARGLVAPAEEGADRQRPASSTIREATDIAARRLRAAGVEPARHEARLLVGLATGLPAERIIAYPESALNGAAQAALEAFVARRCSGEPVSRLAGAREFWSLTFRLSPDTLDPRPDSETLVSAVLAAITDRGAPLRILDLGTGTGCLLLSLLHELPNARGVGTDVSEMACRTARENATALGLSERAHFAVGDWGAALTGQFDIVVCNPPYIAEGEIASLSPAVLRFDPRRALVGGADGLAAYRQIAPQLGGILAPGGLAVLEVGAGQSHAVARLLARSRLSIRLIRSDLAGIERCVVAENR